MQNNLAEKEELEVVEVDEEQAEVAVEQPEAEEAPAEAEAKSEDELEQYSESVQRRISKLTNRFRKKSGSGRQLSNMPRRSSSRTKSFALVWTNSISPM